MGDSKASGRRRRPRIVSAQADRIRASFPDFSITKQTANDKSPHFAAAERGDNAARKATKQIDAMQKRAV